MNVRDMHIEVNQSLQQVAANRTRKFLSEETDWVLNKMVNRFVQMKLIPVKGGAFMLNPFDTAALQNLIVPNKPLYSYITGDSEYISYLPCDFAYLLANMSLVKDWCNRTANPISHGANLTVTTLKQSRSTNAGAPYYTSLSITINGITLTLPADAPSGAVPVAQSKDDISFLVPFILRYFRERGINIYWERFDTMYKPNSYLIVGSAASTVQLIVDGVDSTSSTDTVLTLNRYIESTSMYVGNRLESSITIPSLLNTAFYKPSVISPISELAQGNLYIYADDSFIVTGTAVTYIKKPQVISLALGIDCDLAPEFHQVICDLAVEYLKGRLNDPQGTQIITQDNNRRVIL